MTGREPLDDPAIDSRPHATDSATFDPKGSVIWTPPGNGACFVFSQPDLPEACDLDSLVVLDPHGLILSTG